MLTQRRHKQNICITFIQRRLDVFEAGPTLYECFVYWVGV